MEFTNTKKMCDSTEARIDYSGLAKNSLMNKQATICAALFLYFIYIAAVGLKYFFQIKAEKSTV